MIPEHESLKLEAMELELDESGMFFCPFCRARHEDKLAVTRTSDGLLFICLRASCGQRGFVPSHGTGGLRSTPIPKDTFHPKPFTEATETPPDWVLDYFLEKYELSSYDLVKNGVKYARQSNRMVFSATTRKGLRWGEVAKAEFREKGTPNTKGNPKAVLYPYRKVVKLHYPNVKYTGTIAVVEDCISAIKVAKIMPCVALLGTHLSDEMALDISREASKVVFMLDPDAADKSIKFAKEFRTLFQTYTLFLNKDPKDTPMNDLIDWSKELLD